MPKQDPSLEKAKAEAAAQKPAPAETTAAPTEALKGDSQPSASLDGKVITPTEALQAATVPLMPVEVPKTPSETPPAKPTVEDKANNVPFAPVVRDEMIKSGSADVSGNTVTMNFPVPVTLTIDHHTQLKFREGIQEVPVEIHNHPYLKAHGVTAYAKSTQLEPQGEYIPSLAEWMKAGYSEEAYNRRYGTKGRKE